MLSLKFQQKVHSDLTWSRDRYEQGSFQQGPVKRFPLLARSEESTENSGIAFVKKIGNRFVKRIAHRSHPNTLELTIKKQLSKIAPLIGANASDSSSECDDEMAAGAQVQKVRNSRAGRKWQQDRTRCSVGGQGGTSLFI